ncbi:MAG TPA: zinc ribbon domain-containing protein [Bryobacteraceae bacterium]|nr:zinc ribbon domain-containing protein [Bryobacteraceae bacterium]
MPGFFFLPILRALSDGRVIRKIVSVALKVTAVLVAIGGLILFVTMLIAAFALQAAATFGVILFALIFLGMMAAVAQIYWLRADTIRQLPDSPFTVIPIISVLLRTNGEVYATVGVSIGVGGGILIMIAGVNPMQFLGPMGALVPSFWAGGSFLGGLTFLAYLCIVSFLALLLFYFLAEASVVLVDMALHIRLLVPQAAAMAPAPSVEPVPAPTPAYEAPVYATYRCPVCARELRAGARFCPGCGSQMAGAQ